MKIYRASGGTEKRIACPSDNQRRKGIGGKKNIE